MTVSLPPVLIVGLGLIGGSVGLRLRERGILVRGVSRSQETLDRALERGAVQGGSLELTQEVPQAGLVLVAAPTQTSIRLVAEAGMLARPGTIFTDACSSKQEVVAAMDALPPGIAAVGGHPMAGRELAGIDAADARLFEGATWVLTQTRRSDDASRAACETLATLCGANPLWVEPRDHDDAVAAISHLPLLAAAALVLAAEDSRSEMVWRLASSGFRDATRIAAGEPEMGADLALTNSTALHEAATLFGSHLTALLDAVHTGDKPRLQRLLAQVAARRRGMYGGGE
ncbi:MAG: prephenate dehydrogenase/arogenate dehydrogenase family protein [Chloroflexota bacterium]|nr:prephenate dehydrogenase/arogenate dehydrogenase family protein [Chloroflexota bacterium]